MNRKIMIDNDGVLSDAHSVLIRQYMQTRVGNPLRRRHITTFGFGNIPTVMRCSLQQLLLDYHRIWANDYESIPPLDPAVVPVYSHVLTTYQSGIITDNPEKNVKNWLHHVGLPTRWFRQSTERKRIIKNNLKEFSVVVEDNPYYEKRPGQIWIMRNQPWNQGVPCDHRITYSEQLLPLLEHYEREGMIERR